MYNDKKIISASEINRFTYCNYQWYYERLHGTKALRRMFKEKYGEYELKNKDGNFKRGLVFHKNFGRKNLFVFFFKRLIFLAVLAAILYILYTKGYFL